MALAVAIGSYPIIRRLTLRLDHLRKGVERWGEGDLSARIDESGSDELAFLAQRFNHAAERVETLLKSHKSLLANASHELRSPLARIRMGLELMEPQASPAFKEEIQRNIAELDQLVDEILLASRLDARESDIGTHRGGGPHRPGGRGMRARGRGAGADRRRQRPWWCKAWPSCCGAPCATCWRTPVATATAR